MPVRRPLVPVCLAALCLSATPTAAAASAPAGAVAGSLPAGAVAAARLSAAAPWAQHRVPLPTLQAARADTAAAAARYGTRLRPCTDDPAWLCGSIPVPVDRAHPAGRQLSIGFRLLPHRGPGAGAPDVLLSPAGGPGSASTGGYRFFAQFILDPLLDQRDLLLVDRRGTGTSGAIDCRQLQDGVTSRFDFLRSVGACGAQLGPDADRYGSGDVALDLEAVRRALRVPRFSIYASSYGTLDAQAYATRFPRRVRAVVADSGIPARDRSSAYLDGLHVGPAAAAAAALACTRAPSCRAAQPDAGTALRRLVEQVRRDPVDGAARDADNVLRRVHVDEVRLLAGAVGGNPANLGSIAAVADALERGDERPLLRLAAEATLWPSGSGSPTEFSEGLNVASFCNDLDPAWDRQDPVGVRRAKAARHIAALPARAFAPFSVQAVTTLYPPELCLFWPAPDRFTPAVPRGARASDVPALLMSGDLDTITPTAVSLGLRNVFPGAPMLRVAGAGHDSAAWSACARGVAQHFLRTLSRGDVWCDEVPAVVLPAVPEFPRTAADARPAEALPGNASSVLDRRVVTVAVRTVQDAWERSFRQSAPVATGPGLRGGTFDADYASFSDRAVLALHGLRFARDVVVRGSTTLTYADGRFSMRLVVTGPGGRRGSLVVRGTDTLRVHGTLGGRTVVAAVQAN